MELKALVTRMSLSTGMVKTCTPALVVLLALSFSGLQAAGVRADDSPIPPYVGDMGFPIIKGSADPEEFSWEVILNKGQELEAVDDQRAEIYYTEGHQPALEISAEAAHDADGSTVPTTLSVSAGNVLTLTVHHRAGDPDSGEAPFTYPVLAGPGFESSFRSAIVAMPPEEGEEPEAALADCLVPRLRGSSLSSSRRRLRKAGCKVGEVKRAQGVVSRTGKVVRQSPRPGTVLASSASVDVTLGK